MNDIPQSAYRIALFTSVKETQRLKNISKKPITIKNLSILFFI